MRKATICPFCKTEFPLTQQICSNKRCNAYRITPENYEIPLSKRKDLKKLAKVKNE